MKLAVFITYWSESNGKGLGKLLGSLPAIAGVSPREGGSHFVGASETSDV